MFPHIINRLRRTPWAATPATLEAVRDLINTRIGSDFTSLDTSGAKSLVSCSAQAARFFGDDDGPEKKPYSLVDGVAVVPIFGVIGKHLSAIETFCGGVDVDQTLAVIEQAAVDDEAETILLWFNSPGGVVTGLPESAARLREINTGIKQCIAYTDDMCCSAAYWLAAQCDYIFSAPSSDVGSIGVYLAWLDATENAEREGYKLELIKAGDFKAMGHPLKHLSTAERKLLQAGVDDIYSRFKAAVTNARPSVEDSTMQGQTFSFEAQLETGLVDAHYPRVGALIADLAAASASKL